MDDKYHLLYNTERLQSEVRNRSIKGGSVTLTLQVFLLGIGLIRGGILARFISPEDYGVQAMVLGLVSLALIFKDLGLSTAIIREKEITHQQVSNLFWINAGIGLGSMIVVALSGPFIAWFYHRPELVSVCIGLSTAYLFSGLTVQTQALLKRQMLFGRLALVDALANVMATVLAIWLARMGFGYWALIWMQVTTALVTMIGYWCWIGWIPAFPRRGGNTGHMLRIGGDVAGLNVFATLTKNIDSIILGKFYPVVVLGLYSRGLMFHHLLENQLRNSLSSVALPGLSSLQANRHKFRAYFLKYLQVIGFLTTFPAMFMLVFAEEIIYYYLGKQWLGVVPYLRVLSLDALISSVAVCPAHIPLTLGFSKRYLWTGVLKGAIRMVGVVIGIIGWGGMGAAYGLLAADVVLVYPYLLLCIEHSSVTVNDYIMSVTGPFALAVAAGGVARIAYRSAMQNAVGCMVSMAIYCALYFIGFIIIDFLKTGSRLGVVATVLGHSRRFRRRGIV